MNDEFCEFSGQYNCPDCAEHPPPTPAEAEALIQKVLEALTHPSPRGTMEDKNE